MSEDNFEIDPNYEPASIVLLLLRGSGQAQIHSKGPKVLVRPGLTRPYLQL